jgi:hypothetical protein
MNIMDEEGHILEEHFDLGGFQMDKDINGNEVIGWQISLKKVINVWNVLPYASSQSASWTTTNNQIKRDQEEDNSQYEAQRASWSK